MEEAEKQEEWEQGEALAAVSAQLEQDCRRYARRLDGEVIG